MFGYGLSPGPGVNLDAVRARNYPSAVKTITVTVEDDVYATAEDQAARRKTTVNQLAQEALRQALAPHTASLSDEERDRRQRLELAEALKRCNLVLGYRPSREKTYER